MDRITRLRIKNVRAIETLDLEMSSMTVLIGENGSGKSTILEVLEVLRKTTESSFMQQFYQIHRGMNGLLRKGASSFSLGVVLEDDENEHPRLEYELTLSPEGAGAVIEAEQLLYYDKGNPHVGMKRNRNGYVTQSILPDSDASTTIGQLNATTPVLGVHTNVPADSDMGVKAIARLSQALQNIEVHLGFDTLASWASSSVGRTNSLRSSSMLLPAQRLTIMGQNLANSWSALKNMGEEHWQQTMALVRLGLGDNVDSVLMAPDAGGGNISLLLKRTDLSEPIPSAYLSDGQLSWLGFVAMTRLNPERSLLAIDEPELHMHPSLLGRVMSLLGTTKRQSPVLLSTHSDRVLELIDDPAGAARICELHGSKAVISTINKEELPKWLDEFGDLGQLRSSGYLHKLLTPTPKLSDSFGELQ